MVEDGELLGGCTQPYGWVRIETLPVFPQVYLLLRLHPALRLGED